MPSLSDAAIRAAISRAERTRRAVALTDGDGRGVGRLRLNLRPTAARVVAEWYAQQWRDGRRTLSKLSLAD